MLILILLTGLLSSFSYDYFLIKEPLSAWQRPKAALYLHTGTWLLSCAIVLLLCQRPWFAVILLNAGQLLLLLVHHAKYHSLREAFIYQDFDYFTDAIKHPRLYLPFFGIARTLGATLAFISAVSIGVLIETPLNLSVLFTSSFILIILAYGLIRLGLANPPKLSYLPEQDLQLLGQLAFFWGYWQAEREAWTDINNAVLNETGAHLNNQNKLPSIIAVQSESFFDARALSATIKTEVLTNFDNIKKQSHCHGRFIVPAWGANTVRTEAAFLTALSPEQLGIHRFNPYRLFAKQAVNNIVSLLKQRGYYSVCIHPYPASFYERDKVFPRLGFDEFIDIKAFTMQADYNKGNENGQFIADLNVAAKIESLLSAHPTNKPLFIFVITMENHGPLHLESASVADNAAFYKQTPPAHWQDLTVYLKHLQNADNMIAQLQQSLLNDALNKNRDGVLCWYGDHVPIMPQVYHDLGEPNGDTEYFIWQTKKNATTNSQEQTLSAHELAVRLLKSL